MTESMTDEQFLQREAEAEAIVVISVLLIVYCVYGIITCTTDEEEYDDEE